MKSVLALVGKPQVATNSGAFERQAAELQAHDLERLYRQAWPIYQRYYLAVNAQHAQVYAGVVAGLTYLKARGFRLACLTNKPTNFALAFCFRPRA